MAGNFAWVAHAGRADVPLPICKGTLEHDVLIGLTKSRGAEVLAADPSDPLAYVTGGSSTFVVAPIGLHGSTFGLLIFDSPVAGAFQLEDRLAADLVAEVLAMGFGLRARLSHLAEQLTVEGVVQAIE